MSVIKKRLTHAERVFNFLKKQKQPLTAYEILDLLRSDGITAATTVYRALDKLHQNGLIHRIESLNAWTICCGSHKNKIPVFEICNDCGDVKEHLDQKSTIISKIFLIEQDLKLTIRFSKYMVYVAIAQQIYN